MVVMIDSVTEEAVSKGARWGAPPRAASPQGASLCTPRPRSNGYLTRPREGCCSRRTPAAWRRRASSPSRPPNLAHSSSGCTRTPCARRRRPRRGTRPGPRRPTPSWRSADCAATQPPLPPP
ncbi:hypothetical protein FOCC_FOCC014969, partial [Frankliniella occidentalis]